jgi:hypothetical protein
MANKQKKQDAKKEARRVAASTQAYLNISEIKDGVIVLKDGSLRSVLMTSAVNFALKSSQEQDAMIFAYQRFLNSLTFPVQILAQSRRIDLDFYLDKLTKQAEGEGRELIKVQILEYTDFIKRLISVTNIMDKHFFVIVPFYPPALEEVKGISKLLGLKPKADPKKLEAEFQKNRVQLKQRVEAVASGLGGIGVRAVTLSSEELVELFYSIYNPGTSANQRFANIDDLTAASIKSSGKPSPSRPDQSGVKPTYEPIRDEKADQPSPPPPASPTGPGPSPAVSGPPTDLSAGAWANAEETGQSGGQVSGSGKGAK